ncbi:uncharacterized protein N7483_009510 [Penicillium malachiteum]|uniref:uncharacterized protein n=1 Tax=Penicillium malachiteum TaxID=1324776 RepID=UPI002548082D|nr:uncharacterized protein N7483_009510 [Penicillium malachiteum]KAJ5721576.1 hypothetical protein N7483_009510 [Penicillium malachiteum]
MSPKTWFLPPDFTFLENGLIQLGTVIPHPHHPTRVLLQPEELSIATPPICLPPVQALVENNHSHVDSRSNTIGGEIWGNFVQMASASLKLDTKWMKEVQYGVVDHEVQSFSRPFTMDTLANIVAQPAVRKYMDSGLWVKRPVYIVSGLRITKMGMSVTMGQSKSRGGGIEGSVPVPAGGVPVVVGAGIHGERRQDKTDSYETAPRIVFAYRLNIIRQRQSGNLESALFSHRTAFMTGGTEQSMEVEVAEVDLSVLQDVQDEDEDPLQFIEHKVGETDVCVSVGCLNFMFSLMNQSV